MSFKEVVAAGRVQENIGEKGKFFMGVEILKVKR